MAKQISKMKFYKQILIPALKKSFWTSLWLLKIILPISLSVRFLDYFGILVYVAEFLSPVFSYMGLPGSTAIVFITSIFLPLYAPLAIIMSMSITLRELTILALMCQITHNMPVESAIQAKTGTPFWTTFSLRIAMSIVVGLALNLILPQDMGMPIFAQTNLVIITSVSDVLWAWLISSLGIMLLTICVVTTLNVLYGTLLHYNLVEKLSISIVALLKFFGLPKNTGFLWLIGNIVGLTYGGAMMMEQMKDGTVSRNDAKILNYHLAVSHSMIEDNLLFVALGVSLWWILGVRLALAWVIVWCVRIFRFVNTATKNG